MQSFLLSLVTWGVPMIAILSSVGLLAGLGLKPGSLGGNIILVSGLVIALAWMLWVGSDKGEDRLNEWIALILNHEKKRRN